MEEHDYPFVEIDLQTFQNCRYDIIVVNGKIISLSETIISKLVAVTESSETSKRCDPDDITIIVDQNQQHILWDYKMLL